MKIWDFDIYFPVEVNKKVKGIKEFCQLQYDVYLSFYVYLKEIV